MMVVLEWVHWWVATLAVVMSVVMASEEEVMPYYYYLTLNFGKIWPTQCKHSSPNLIKCCRKRKRCSCWEKGTRTESSSCLAQSPRRSLRWRTAWTASFSSLARNSFQRTPLLDRAFCPCSFFPAAAPLPLPAAFSQMRRAMLALCRQ